MFCAALILPFGFASHAGIERISDGGVEVVLSDILPSGEPAVVVIYTSWDQTSISLIQEMESWSENYPDLAIILIDAADQRTGVFRQFSLTDIPSIIVFNRQHNQAGDIVDNVEALESVLKEYGLL